MVNPAAAADAEVREDDDDVDDDGAGAIWNLGPFPRLDRPDLPPLTPFGGRGGLLERAELRLMAV